MFTNGMGEVLYESATIAFDTIRGIYFNPQTNQDYGSTPPNDGWKISWYQGDNGEVVVGSGVSYVSQTQQQADALKQNVMNQLANQSKGPTGSSTSQPVVSTQGGIFNWLGSHSMFGIPDLYLGVGVVGLGLLYMLGGGHKGGRR